MKPSKLVMLLLAIVMFNACQSDDDNGPQNSAPVLEDTVLNMTENPTSDLITTLSATDADGDDLTYTIISQTPANSVTINETTGEVYIANASAFDYDNNQTIIVIIQISDGTVNVNAQLTINIEQQNA